MKHPSWIAVGFAALVGVIGAVIALTISTVAATVSWIVQRPAAVARRAS